MDCSRCLWSWDGSMAERCSNGGDAGQLVASLTDWDPLQVARLGVTSILVHSGMTCQAFQQGLHEHARQDNGR